MSKNKDFMTPERWKYIKKLRPTYFKILPTGRDGVRAVGRNAYKRAKKVYDKATAQNRPQALHRLNAARGV